MNFFESLEIALKSLWVNKMRTLLTMLGIIIGISSVIAVVAIGDGSKSAITNEFENIGMNRIILMTNWQEDIYSNDQLTYRDYEMINRNLGDQIKASSVDMFFNGSVLDYGDQKKEIDVSIEAVSDEYNNIENITIDQGRFLNNQDLKSRNNNVVIQEDLAIERFGRSNVLGERISISIREYEQTFTIVGIMTPAETLVPEPLQQQGYKVYMPYTTAAKILNLGNQIGYLDFNLNDDVDVNEFKDSAISLVEKIHNNEGQNKYTYQSVEGQLSIIQNIMGILTTVVGSIAGISLFVGGIGIMNIMLVSVTERTREIGIRKALGATRRDILMQFLVESMIISGLGGIIGISLGIGFSKIISLVIDMPAQTNIGIILIAFVFSTIVGMFFGIYPANKAAKLDPIESLRYE